MAVPGTRSLERSSPLASAILIPAVAASSAPSDATTRADTIRRASARTTTSPTATPSSDVRQTCSNYGARDRLGHVDHRESATRIDEGDIRAGSAQKGDDDQLLAPESTGTCIAATASATLTAAADAREHGVGCDPVDDTRREVIKAEDHIVCGDGRPSRRTGRRAGYGTAAGSASARLPWITHRRGVSPRASDGQPLERSAG